VSACHHGWYPSPLWLMSASLLALLPVYLPVVTCLLGMSCGCLWVMSAVNGGPNCTLEICSENSIGYLYLSPGSDSIIHICLSLCEINALSSRNKLFYCLLFPLVGSLRILCQARFALLGSSLFRLGENMSMGWWLACLSMVWWILYLSMAQWLSSSLYLVW
jgi:hypothetical protein